MLSHCFLTSMVSDEKVAINLIEHLFYRISHLSLTAFKMTSFGFQQFEYNVSHCGTLSLFYLEFAEVIWSVDICISSNLRCLGHHFFKNYLCFFFSFIFYSMKPSTWCLMGSLCSIQLPSFSMNFFSSDCIVLILSSSISFILSSPCLNLLLNSCIKF